MKIAIMLAVLLGARAHAALDSAVLMRSALQAGFAPAALEAPVSVPVPMPVQVNYYFEGDVQTVALAPLLDRHLSRTDAYMGAGGVTLVSGTLDLSGRGYLAVTPPGGEVRFIRIEVGMTGKWNDGVHEYEADLAVHIFRPRSASVIRIRETETRRVLWEKSVGELFRLTYNAGERVSIGGRPYRLFYSARPTWGLCFIYDDTSAGWHDHKFYMVPLERIQDGAFVPYVMFGGDVVKLRLSPDRSTLQILR